MMSQYHYECYELDLQKIVKHDGNCLFLKNLFLISGNMSLIAFVDFSSKCLYIVMVDRDRIKIMQKLFKILECVVMYYP